MKWGIFSDLHLKNGGRKIQGLWDKKLVDGLTVLDEVIDLFEDKEVDGFIFPGDFFHQRYKIDVKILHGATEIMQRLRDKLGYFVVGNHDMYIKSEVNSVFFYGLKWKVFDKIDDDGNFLFVPYQKQFSDKDYEKINKKGRGKIIVMHQILKGMKYQNGYMPVDGEVFDVDRVDGYKMILSGHNHVPKQNDNDNIVALGSVMHLDFGDTGDRGCWILDDKKCEIEFFEMKSPKYITLDKIPDKVDDNNYYKVRMSDKDFKGTMDIPENVEIVVVPKEEVVDRLELGNNFEMEDVIKKYVKMKDKPKDYASVGIEIIKEGE